MKHIKVSDFPWTHKAAFIKDSAFKVINQCLDSSAVLMLSNRERLGFFQARFPTVIMLSIINLLSSLSPPRGAWKNLINSLSLPDELINPSQIEDGESREEKKWENHCVHSRQD